MRKNLSISASLFYAQVTSSAEVSAVTTPSDPQNADLADSIVTAQRR